jgi:hypothetical protein
VYSDWLPAPLSISAVGRLDHPLYVNLKQWVARHKPPQDLKAFFGSSRKRKTAKEVEAELKRYNIKKPEDAFARFPNDKQMANRLYMARLRRP